MLTFQLARAKMVETPNLLLYSLKQHTLGAIERSACVRTRMHRIVNLACILCHQLWLGDCALYSLRLRFNKACATRHL